MNRKKTVVPVVTFVLYFGTEQRWTQKKNIRSLMEIPKGLEEYVNDFRIHVFEIAWLTEEEINRFQSDFKVVANFLQTNVRIKIIFRMMKHRSGMWMKY